MLRTMLCHACGARLDHGQLFCSACGAPQRATPVPSLEAKAPIWVPSRPTAAGPGTPAQTPFRTKPPFASDTKIPTKGLPAPGSPPGVSRVPLKKNPLTWILLGILGLLWGGMLLSNVLVKRMVEPAVMALPKEYAGCREAVASLHSAVALQQRLSSTPVKAADIKKEGPWKKVQKRCPSIDIRDVDGGLLVESVHELEGDATCRIWAETGEKVKTDCPKK